MRKVIVLVLLCMPVSADQPRVFHPYHGANSCDWSLSFCQLSV